jgi:hypothetical protein
MLRFEIQHPAASEVELWAGRADRDADLPSSSGRDPERRVDIAALAEHLHGDPTANRLALVREIDLAEASLAAKGEESIRPERTSDQLARGTRRERQPSCGCPKWSRPKMEPRHLRVPSCASRLNLLSQIAPGSGSRHDFTTKDTKNTKSEPSHLRVPSCSSWFPLLSQIGLVSGSRHDFTTKDMKIEPRHLRVPSCSSWLNLLIQIALGSGSRHDFTTKDTKNTKIEPRHFRVSS